MSARTVCSEPCGPHVAYAALILSKNGVRPGHRISTRMSRGNERSEIESVGGIRADEHERVRATACVRPVALARVVADDERDRRLAGKRDVELPRGLPHFGRLGRHGGDRLVEVEVGAAGRTRGDDEAGDAEPHGHATDEARARARRPLRLAVEGHGRGRPGRQDRLPVSVRRGSAPQASFQGGSHEGRLSTTSALAGARRRRIAQRQAVVLDPRGRFPTTLPELLTCRGLGHARRAPRPARRSRPGFQP